MPGPAGANPDQVPMSGGGGCFIVICLFQHARGYFYVNCLVQHGFLAFSFAVVLT